MKERFGKLKNFTCTIHVIDKGEICGVKWIFEFEKIHDHGPYPTDLMDYVIGITRDIESHHLQAWLLSYIIIKLQWKIFHYCHLWIGSTNFKCFAFKCTYFYFMVCLLLSFDLIKYMFRVYVYYDQRIIYNKRNGVCINNVPLIYNLLYYFCNIWSSILINSLL